MYLFLAESPNNFAIPLKIALFDMLMVAALAYKNDFRYNIT